MNILKDTRFITAVVGLVAAAVAFKFPSLDSGTATQIATGVVTFVVGLLLPNPKGPDQGK